MGELSEGGTMGRSSVFKFRSLYRTKRAWKNGLLVFTAMVLLVGCIRIAEVNANRVSVPEKHFDAGETVDLGALYFHSDLEAPVGYTVKLIGANLMSPRHYLESMGASVDRIEATIGDEELSQSVLCVRALFGKQGSAETGIQIAGYKVVPDRNDVYYSYDKDLFSAAYPSLGEMMGAFALADDSVFEVSIPFTWIANPEYLQSYEEERRLSIEESKFRLLLGNAPERTFIDFETA